MDLSAQVHASGWTSGCCTHPVQRRRGLGRNDGVLFGYLVEKVSHALRADGRRRHINQAIDEMVRVRIYDCVWNCGRNRHGFNIRARRASLSLTCFPLPARLVPTPFGISVKVDSEGSLVGTIGLGPDWLASLVVDTRAFVYWEVRGCVVICIIVIRWYY